MVAAERRQVDEKVKKIIELKNKVEKICFCMFDSYTLLCSHKFWSVLY